MIRFSKLFILLLTSSFLARAPMQFVFAADETPAKDLSLRLSSLIIQTLEEKIPNAEIKIPSLESVVQKSPIADFEEIKSVRLIEDRPGGIAIIEVAGVENKAENQKTSTQVLQTTYEAWVKVPVASHRIYPNTKLKNEDFSIQAVNVASGSARQYRGVMTAVDTKFDKMESRQTILEGQFVVSSALQRQPDVRRGELLKLELVSGDLSLMTQAVAEEPASIGDRVRVLTVKTKKEIVGKVKEDHSVEVVL